MNSGGAGGGGGSWRTPPDDTLIVADPVTGQKVRSYISLAHFHTLQVYSNFHMLLTSDVHVHMYICTYVVGTYMVYERIIYAVLFVLLKWL